MRVRDEHMQRVQDRVMGVLIGLAAGDRIGGPLRMAIRVAESLSEQGYFDVHDIGKKIVALMLRNSGYRVIDLGKSVDAATIIQKAEEHQADIIGLSALMTTTMTEMPGVIAAARDRLADLGVSVSAR